MNKHLIPTFEQLWELYSIKRKTSRQIGKIYGVTKGPVLKWLRSYKIPLRYYRDKKGSYTKDELTQLYSIEKLSQWKIAIKYGVSQATIGYWMIRWGIPRRSSSELVSGSNNPFYGKRHTKEEIEKERNSAYHRNLGGSKNPFYGRHHTEEALKRMMTARLIKPNKAELKLDKLLEDLTPDFAYNGDFREGVAIGGKVPDWVNVNGQKKVIELLGHGWHIQNKWFKVPLGKTREEIVKHYQKFGWNCLAVYDYELQNQTLLKDKIHNFLEES